MKTLTKELEALFSEHDRLEAEYVATGMALKKLSGGGPMGLTPDSVRATPEWKEAKRASAATFAAYRAFNATNPTLPAGRRRKELYGV
ncbi:MAG TPA: hypothetical protein VJA26_14700 [Gammaproteobacteria bacterium]|nr:hypothetical protein [Gammaproteobacteria bacterium]